VRRLELDGTYSWHGTYDARRGIGVFGVFRPTPTGCRDAQYLRTRAGEPAPPWAKAGRTRGETRRRKPGTAGPSAS